MKRFLLIFAMLSAHVCLGQLWSGILTDSSACSLLASGTPNQCAIDWTSAGVGSIPARTTIYATVNASACPGGTSNCASVIQTQLNSCPSGDAVLLGSGTFRINTTVNVPSNCTLRGAGANNTILDAHGASSTSVLTLGSRPSLGSETAITSGGTAGSNSIVVASASGISIGTYLLVSMINDGAVATTYGGEGVCDYCDTNWNGARSTNQIVQVTSVSGTTLGITPTLHTDFSPTQTAPSFSGTFVEGQIAEASGTIYVCTNTTCSTGPPGAHWQSLINGTSATILPMSETMAGVENLQVEANNTGYSYNFYMGGCAYCWIKGVEANYTDGDFVRVEFGFHDETRDSYFSNAYGHGPGTTDSDVNYSLSTSESLIENNIIERGHVAIMLELGGMGNVVGYNYTEGEFDSGAPMFQMGGIVFHGANPEFTLLEGNVTNRIEPDEIHGGAAYTTMLRNWSLGTTVDCNPLTGRGTVGCSPIYYNYSSGNPSTSGWWQFQGSRAFGIDHLTVYSNLIGNVAGSGEQSTQYPYCNNTTGSGCTQAVSVASIAYPTSRSYDSDNYNLSFGYGEANDDGSGTGCDGSIVIPCHSTNAAATAFLHGNFTYANSTIAWAGGVTHTLPASFYHSTRPWFVPLSLAWPAIGPDVTSGGSDSGTHASLIPAQNAYLNLMGGSVGGSGSPLSFNASTLYPTSSPVPAPAAVIFAKRF